MDLFYNFIFIHFFQNFSLLFVGIHFYIDSGTVKSEVFQKTELLNC